MLKGSAYQLKISFDFERSCTDTQLTDQEVVHLIKSVIVQVKINGVTEAIGNKPQETVTYRNNGTMAPANRRLLKEYQELSQDAPEGIVAGPVSEENLFVWECLLEGPPDTPYENGVFSATLTFPKDYPLSPPTLKFNPPILHPNIYSDGTVCISILHAPGDDPLQYERAEERWSPVQSVEKILLSVMSMLAEPNVESGANIDACKLWREDRLKYDALVKQQVMRSLGL